MTSIVSRPTVSEASASATTSTTVNDQYYCYYYHRCSVNSNKISFDNFEQLAKGRKNCLKNLRKKREVEEDERSRRKSPQVSLSGYYEHEVLSTLFA